MLLKKYKIGKYKWIRSFLKLGKDEDICNFCTFYTINCDHKDKGVVCDKINYIYEHSTPNHHTCYVAEEV